MRDWLHEHALFIGWRPGRPTSRCRVYFRPVCRRWSAEIASFSSVATPRRPGKPSETQRHSIRNPGRHSRKQPTSALLRMGTTSTTSLNSIFQKPIGRERTSEPPQVRANLIHRHRSERVAIGTARLRHRFTHQAISTNRSLVRGL